MKEHIDAILKRLESGGNLRSIPEPSEDASLIDMGGNDYLGLNADADLRREIYGECAERQIPLSSCASRLLASHQTEYTHLEGLLQQLYGRPALLFNSGYHANTGILSSLADRDTLVVSDKLVHASIIDGIVLSRATLLRYKHNDYDALERILAANATKYPNVLIVTESVFSMDGDSADIERIGRIRRQYDNALLYVDEAHAVGVCGQHGLGLCYGNADVDIIVGTMGKALASEGAYAITSETVRRYLVNRARALIYSTALAPINAYVSARMLERAITMDAERSHLRDISLRLSSVLGSKPSHIQPYIVGDSQRAIAISEALKERHVRCLPIRTPTVPAGTERLRFSLSAAMSDEQIEYVCRTLAEVLKESAQ